MTKPGPHPKPIPEDWQEYIDQWDETMAVRGLSFQTRYTWRHKVAHLARAVRKPPEAVTSNDIIHYMARGRKKNTLRSDHSALSSFYAYLVDHGDMPANPMTAVPLTKRPTTKLPPAPSTAVDAARHADQRTLLMTLLMSDMGLRRMEVAQIHTHDLIRSDGHMVLTVHGKGDKDRRIPVPGNVASLIEQRCKAVGDGWLFPSHNHSVVYDRHITSARVGRILRDATGWPCHAFRRKFGTDLWQATGDVMVVKELLGHASLTTTQRYIWTTEEELRDAMGRLISWRAEHERGTDSEGKCVKALEAYGIPSETAAALVKQIRGILK